MAKLTTLGRFLFIFLILSQSISAQTKGICCDGEMDDESKIKQEVQEFLVSMSRHWKDQFHENKDFPTLQSFTKAVEQKQVALQLKKNLKPVVETCPEHGNDHAGTLLLPLKLSKDLARILDKKRSLALGLYLGVEEKMDNENAAKTIEKLKELIKNE